MVLWALKHFFHINVVVSFYLQPFTSHIQLKLGPFEGSTLYIYNLLLNSTFLELVIKEMCMKMYDVVCVHYHREKCTCIMDLQISTKIIDGM